MIVISDVKEMNAWLQTALKSEILDAQREVCFTSYENDIYRMKYIERRNIDFIADALGYETRKISRDLKILREKMTRFKNLKVN